MDAEITSLRSVYERWKKATPRAEGTYRLREVALRVLAKGGIVSLKDATTPRLVANYIEARSAADMNVRTIIRDVITITVLLRYLVKTHELERKVYDSIIELCPKPKKRKKFSAEILELGEIEDLHRAAVALELRETALAIRIVQHAGLRTGELLGLCAEHFDWKRKHIVVRFDARVKGSTGHKTGERLVPLVRELFEYLQGKLPERGPVFPCTRFTKTGRTVKSAEFLREGLRRAARLAGLTDKRIDYRILSRTRETTWAANPNMPRAYLGLIMGHDPEVGETSYQRMHDGYNPVCETPSNHKTTPTQKRPQGFTPTRALTPAEVAELQALERAILARRDREAT